MTVKMTVHEDLHYDTGMLDGLPCQWLYKYA